MTQRLALVAEWERRTELPLAGCALAFIAEQRGRCRGKSWAGPSTQVVGPVTGGATLASGERPTLQAT